MKPSFLASKPSLTYTLIASPYKSMLKTIFNNVSQVSIFREVQDAGGLLVKIVPFTMMFMVFIFLCFINMGSMEGVTIIESFLGMR
jgi:hypothetical protein